MRINTMEPAKMTWVQSPHDWNDFRQTLLSDPERFGGVLDHDQVQQLVHFSKHMEIQGEPPCRPCYADACLSIYDRAVEDALQLLPPSATTLLPAGEGRRLQCHTSRISAAGLSSTLPGHRPQLPGPH